MKLSNHVEAKGLLGNQIIEKIQGVRVKQKLIEY